MLNKTSTAIALSFLIITSAHAETDIQWYEVELIFYRQLSSTGIDSETWKPELIQPDTGACINLHTGTNTDELGQLIPYSTIPKSELRLINEAAAIARSKGQRLMAHTGWRQPGFDQNNSAPIRITAGPLLLAKPLKHEEGQEESMWSIPVKEDSVASGNQTSAKLYTTTTPKEFKQNTANTNSYTQNAIVTPLTDNQQIIDIEIADSEQPLNQPQQQVIATTKLNGCVTIYRERYLHILTDLIYYHEDNEDIYADEEESYSFGKQINATAIPVKSRRRMRSRELHYLDNPAVGIVVLVTPYDFAESTDEVQE
ncbi:MAG: hypothetical protein D6B28_09295 [Gammaproteobacteria bacterium]|nr:MAG: hypothetical protein D6B28_09295 [Gammaproteobacteria bacterium]